MAAAILRRTNGEAVGGTQSRHIRQAVLAGDERLMEQRGGSGIGQGELSIHTPLRR